MAKVYERSDKHPRWWVTYYDALGTRRRVPGGKTKAEAELVLSDKIREAQGPAVEPVDPKLTVAAWADQWLKSIEGDVEPRTLESYRESLTRHILPALGGHKLRKLTPFAIKTFLSGKRKTLKPNSVRLLRATLSVMLGDANLPVNPVRNLERRRGKKADRVRKKKVRPMTHAHIEAFLATCEREASPRDRLLFLTLADAGLRPGEAVALQPEDFDVVGGTLRIERAFSAGKIKSTKTGHARDVDMTQRLHAAWERAQAARELDALTAASSTDGTPAPQWMFPSRTGRPLTPKAVYHRFRALLVQAGIPKYSLYALRHSYGAHMIAANAPINYVAAQMGHTDDEGRAQPATTLRYYADWLPVSDKRWLRAMEHARRSAMSTSTGNGHLMGTRRTETLDGVAEVAER